jgi:hypothetical protein
VSSSWSSAGSRQAGEHLEPRPRELTRRAARVGDVLDLRVELLDPVIVVADRRDPDAHLDHFPVAAQVPALEPARALAAAHQRGDGELAGAAVVGVHEVGEQRAQELALGVPGHRANRVVDALDAAVRRAHDAAERGLLECDPVALDALLAAGDVADRADRERPLTELHAAHADLDREARAVLAARHRLGLPAGRR